MKLQLFSLALVVVPGVLFALIALARARDALERAVGRQLAEVAHDVVEEIAGALDAEQKTVRTWASQDVMRDVVVGDLDKRIARFLRALTAGGAPYLDLVCIDRDGRVVAATDAAHLGEQLGDRDWARAALAGTDWLAGPFAVDGPARTVEIAAPIRDPEGGGVLGALLGRYDWGHAMTLTDRIRSTLVPHGVVLDVVLLDRAGAELGASWRDGLTGETATARRAAAGRVAATVPGSRRRGYTNDAAAGVLVGYERGDESARGWLALALEPVTEAFAPVYEMQSRLGLALAAVLLGALGIATLLAARMSRPLRELTRATREIAQAGEPRHPVAVRSHDEIGQLAASFNAMAAQLKRAQDDLLGAAKFAFVGEVAAGVAHEVRTPLGILRSSAQMLGRTLAGGPPESRELIEMIVEEVDRLDRVVAGLLELARPHELLIEPTPLAPVLARALDFVEAQAREKHIALYRAFAADMAPARCDPEEIYQVALNLLVNALQILPAGGTVTVRTLPRIDGQVGFEVSDDGPGIPPEHRDRIFTPFFTMREGGTGLGLALVQRVVRAHEGSVTVESAEGRGTTFRILLPAERNGR